MVYAEHYSFVDLSTMDAASSSAQADPASLDEIVDIVYGRLYKLKKSELRLAETEEEEEAAAEVRRRLPYSKEEIAESLRAVMNGFFSADSAAGEAPESLDDLMCYCDCKDVYPGDLDDALEMLAKAKEAFASKFAGRAAAAFSDF